MGTIVTLLKAAYFGLITLVGIGLIAAAATVVQDTGTAYFMALIGVFLLVLVWSAAVLVRAARRKVRP